MSFFVDATKMSPGAIQAISFSVDPSSGAMKVLPNESKARPSKLAKAFAKLRKAPGKAKRYIRNWPRKQLLMRQMRRLETKEEKEARHARLRKIFLELEEANQAALHQRYMDIFLTETGQESLPNRIYRPEYIRIQKALAAGTFMSIRYSDIGRVDREIDEEDGKRAGQYCLDNVLGQGGFGKVFATSTNPAAAIKVLDKSRITTRHSLRQTNREIGLLRRHGHHPNIIGLLDVMHAPNNIYLVQEKATMDLKDLFFYSNAPKEQADLLQQVMRGILNAVSEIHSNGVAHLDLKPSNVLVCTSAVDEDNNLLPGCRIEASDIRLCDFGVSAVSKNYDASNATAPAKDLSIVLCPEDWSGSHIYAAPELILHPQSEGRIADMWSLGVTLMQLAGYMTEEWFSIYDILKSGDLQLYESHIFFNLEYKKEYLPVDEEGKLLHNLIFEHLLTMDVAKRLSAAEALRHPWFQYQSEDVGH